MAKDWSESIEKSLLHILKDIEEEDKYLRQRMLRECKQNELYWHGFQYIFWDERVGDFRIPTQEVMSEIASREETKYIYDYVVNIFKAHGLSIIAALSAEVPSVPFSPMDADNQQDVIAAQKAEALGKIIHKYNKSKLIFYHALFTLFTNNFVIAYNYYERDKKFGVTEVPKFKNQKGTDSYQCSNDRNEGDETCDYKSEEEQVSCPECSSSLNKVEGVEEVVEDGSESVNRGMEKFVIKGTLNWKLPTYAADQDACGYAIEYTDQHYAWVRKNYTNLERSEIGPSSSDSFEKQARQPSIGRIYSEAYLNSLLTVKRVWLRSWMFDSLDEDNAKELMGKYPNGCRFTVVECGKQMIAEIEDEQLDDHITIAKGDLSRTVHGDPLGKPLIPMQDLENMLMNLNVESIEHSIATTFADPEILDFDVYSQQEIKPGLVYPFKSGFSLGQGRKTDDYFYDLKTSSLSSDSVKFGQIVENKGQFVVGAFPSIFGGPQTEGSKTLGEYQESRSYALQRLSIPYQLLFIWFADLTYKSVIDYISNMLGDEKFSIQGQQAGSYVSIQFLSDEFKSGSFSKLLPESAVDLPESFSQKRSRIESILQLNSDTLNQFLFSAENRKSTLRYLGLEELCDLDSNQTTKQLIELDVLLKQEPVENPNPQDPEGIDINVSSIPVEPEIDDSEIHLRVLRTYLSSPIGQEHKKSNPKGYENALLHAREHLLMNRQNMMMMNQEQPKEQEKEEVVE